MPFCNHPCSAPPSCLHAGASTSAAAATAHQGYQIIRRNGAVVRSSPNKIAVALMKAFWPCTAQGAASASVRARRSTS